MPLKRTAAPGPETYAVIRLHQLSEKSWAVIASSTGAILVEGDRLMMSLDRDEALRVAEAATVAASLAALATDAVEITDPPTLET